MYNTGDIYRIIQDALDANQIYCTDSKLGDGSEDTYETDTEFVSGNDAHLIATVRHQHFDYNRPYQENEYTEKFLNYNLELPQNIGFMHILIDEKKKELLDILAKQQEKIESQEKELADLKEQRRSLNEK